MAIIKLSGKYSHLECILDDDWAQMFTDGSVKLEFRAGYAFIYSRTKDGILRSNRVHSIIMDTVGSTKSMVVDHINRNKLDNRRENLRVVSPHENSQNISDSGHADSEMQCRGLNRVKHRGTYEVSWMSNGKRLYRKTFRDLKDAMLVAEFHRRIRFL